MAPDLDIRNRFREVLYEALAGPETGARDSDPLALLSRAVEGADPRIVTDDAALILIGGLASIAQAPTVDEAAGMAQEAFATPERFREALYFARCLERDGGALELWQARRYLEETSVPASFPDLLTDRDAVLDAATFTDLWRDATRLEWMLHTTAIWQREYAATYVSKHAALNAEVAVIAERIESLAPQARALERLNGLTRLGPPLAVAALSQFHELERLVGCSLHAGRLSDALANDPVCPECAFHLGDEAPAADARRVRLAVERGLAGQQTRLAQRVVSRLLSRPSTEDRLTRFIEVVQANDVAGLALLLDDSLLAFLRDLLEMPDDETDLLLRFARTFPEVTAGSLDAAVAEFRRLLEEGLARGGGRLQLYRGERA